MTAIMKSAMILTWDALQMTAEVICSPGRREKFFKKGIDNPKGKCYTVIVKREKHLPRWVSPIRDKVGT